VALGVLAGVGAGVAVRLADGVLRLETTISQFDESITTSLGRRGKPI